MRTLLLHNPTAGASHPNHVELTDQLTQVGYAPVYQSTKDKAWKNILKERWDLVVVAGGDGTVARTARALLNRKVALAIVPVGTANNIARALGLNGNAENIVPHLPRATVRKLDIGLARGPWGKRHFLEAVGFGLIAKAISQSGPRPPKALRIDNGREDLQKTLEEVETERFKINIDGDVFAGDFLFVEIMNLARTGPALPISVDAAPGDGLLDVVFCFEQDRIRLSKWLNDPEATSCPVTVRRGRKVDLKWEHGHARIDDRVYLPSPERSKVKIKLEKKSLQVLVPEPTHLPLR
jgi:diacylglycerol kinase family enzyme